MNVIEPHPPEIRRVRINLPGAGRRIRLERITFDPGGGYTTSEVEITLKGADHHMNTTRIYEPDEQDTDHFEMATWYGPTSTPARDVPEDDKLKLYGWENSFEIIYEGYSVELDKEDLAGLRLMLDTYEDWRAAR